jgi:hypothetical protein
VASVAERAPQMAHGSNPVVVMLGCPRGGLGALIGASAAWRDVGGDFVRLLRRVADEQHARPRLASDGHGGLDLAAVGFIRRCRPQVSKTF